MLAVALTRAKTPKKRGRLHAPSEPPEKVCHFLLCNLDYPIMKTALIRHVTARNVPSTNISNGREAAAVDTPVALAWDATGVPGKPVHAACLVARF